MFHRKITRSAAILVAAASALALAACSSGTPASTTKADPNRPLTIGIVIGLDTNTSYQSMYCGAKAAAKQLGNVTVKFNGTAGSSAAEEVPILTSYMRTSPDGVIVVPADPAGMQVTLEAAAKQAPLITADIAPTKPVGLTAIGPDNTKGGAEAAEFLADKMNHKGTVYVNSYIPGTDVDTERVGGFKTYMAKNDPDIKILPTDYSKAVPTTAAQQTAAALRAHPEITGLYGQNELTAVGMATAVREAGKAGKIPFVAYDADETEVTALKAGTFSALVSQGFYYEGYDAVKIMTSVLRGKTAKEDVKPVTASSIKVLTAANVDESSSKPFIYTSCK
jgi:ribose transport system substrate-binding protein